MPSIPELRLKIAIGGLVPWWWRFAYLIPDIFVRHKDYLNNFLKDLEKRDSEFNKFVKTNLEAYINKGKMPADNIAGPIINLAEDLMAGRDLVIRAGDYIALQNAMRAIK